MPNSRLESMHQYRKRALYVQLCCYLGPKCQVLWHIKVIRVNVSVSVDVEFKVTFHEQVRYRGTLQY